MQDTTTGNLTRHRRAGVWTAVAAAIALVIALGTTPPGGAEVLAAPDPEPHPRDRGAAALFAAPALRISYRGAEGAWVIGVPVTVRWTQRRLSGTDILVQISRDRGRTWRTVTSAPAERGHATWTVDGAAGRVWLRVATGDARATSPIRRVELVPGVTDIQFGTHYGVALHSDGMLRGWGAFISGLSWAQPSIRTRSMPLDGLSDVVAVSATSGHLAAITRDGSVWLQGGARNPGDPIVSPERVEGVTDARAVRAGNLVTFISIDDGRWVGITGSVLINGNVESVYQDGTRGELGAVVALPELDGCTDIALGWSHGIALRPDGTLLSWGQNYAGQLGRPGYAKFSPAPIPNLTDVVAIAVRDYTSMALRSDGTVWIWGYSCGLVTDERGWPIGTDTPLQVPGVERAIWMGGGGSPGSTCFALRDDGALFGWGENSAGCLLGPKKGLYPTPVRARTPPLSRVFVSGGGGQAFDRKGRRFGWGVYGSSAAGTHDYTPRLTRIHAR